MNIVLKDIKKKYSKTTTIQYQDVVIKSGVLNLFVGENGVGKTTLIKCILSQIKYDGKISMNNEIFSYMPDFVNLPSYIKVIDYLTLFGKYEVICKELMKFNMIDAKNRYLLQLSKGMCQKVTLIATLIKDATCYIFDEPTNGLDSESVKIFINEINRLLLLDKKVIIITHNVELYKEFSYELHEMSEFSEKVN